MIFQTSLLVFKVKANALISARLNVGALIVRQAQHKKCVSLLGVQLHDSVSNLILSWRRNLPISTNVENVAHGRLGVWVGRSGAGRLTATKQRNQ
jgi:hypothetical protein